MRKRIYKTCISLLSAVLLTLLALSLVRQQKKEYLIQTVLDTAAAGQTLQSETGDSTYLLFPADTPPVSDVSGAIEALADAGLADPSDPSSSLSLKWTAVSDGITVYRFSQVFQGLSVYGREVCLLVDESGSPLAGGGNFCPVSSAQTQPALSLEEAHAAALDYAAETFGQKAAADAAFLFSETTPLVLTMEPDREAEAAYLGFLTVPAGNGSVQLLISGKDGSVLSSLCLTAEAAGNGNAAAETTEEGTSSEYLAYPFLWEFDEFEGHPVRMTFPYDLAYDPESELYRGESSNYHIFLMEDAGGQSLSDVKSNLPSMEKSRFTGGELETLLDHPSGKETAGLKALCYAAMTVSYYRDILSRESFDDHNGDVFVVTGCKGDDGMANNAWSTTSTRGDQMLLSLGSRVKVTPNLVAHEFTHGMTMTICGPYSELAVMECISDVFAELMEAHYADADPDWIMSAFKRSLFPFGAVSFSSILSPPSYSKESLWDLPFGTSAHRKSTVGSYVMYRTWNSWRKSGMSVSEAVRQMSLLLYRSLFFLNSHADYEDFSSALTYAGGVMYGRGEISREQFAALLYFLQDAGMSLPEIEDSEINAAVKLVSQCLVCVKDAETGKPIEGAMVEYSAHSLPARLLPGYDYRENKNYQQQFADSDGTCLFTGLEGYSFSRFHISADGYEGDVYPADMLETFLPEEEPFYNEILLLPEGGSPSPETIPETIPETAPEAVPESPSIPDGGGPAPEVSSEASLAEDSDAERPGDLFQSFSDAFLARDAAAIAALYGPDADLDSLAELWSDRFAGLYSEGDPGIQGLRLTEIRELSHEELLAEYGGASSLPDAACVLEICGWPDWSQIWPDWLADGIELDAACYDGHWVLTP